MALSLELIDMLTPTTPAPGEDDFDKYKLEKDWRRNRRLAWTRFLRSEEFFFKQIESVIPNNIAPWHVGVGLIPTVGFSIEGPEKMDYAIKDSGYTWGVHLAVQPFVGAAAILNTLDFENLRFPIIVSPTSLELHDLTLGSTHNSAIASRTAWASAREVARGGVYSAASSEGMLTARHVTERACHTTLWSSEVGCSYSVYREGSTYVDAVYLEGSWGTISPAAITPKAIDQVATGDRVNLRGAYSNFSCFVTHTPNPHYIGGGSPSHVFLDKSGDSGDSGGLVSDDGDDAISMYIGGATLKDGSKEGLSLSLEQIVNDLEIDLLI